MKLIDTKDAVGHVLCHDITRIIPGTEKGPVFKKGHVVTKEDIPVLLDVGKEHLTEWSLPIFFSVIDIRLYRDP